MRRFRMVLLCAGWSCLAVPVAPVFGQSTIKKEIDVGFAPLEVVRPILQGALSPQGKFVMLSKKGGVLVIDTPEGVLAAEEAIAGADLPQADISLEFQFITGLPQRQHSITVAQEVPFPTAFNPPTIFVGPGGVVGVVGVVPATPTKFATRNIGVTSETSSTYNPDGSITLDINTESTAFEGFINYGSAILPSGSISTVPVVGLIGDPTFFTPYLTTGGISLPVISTTRISTSVVIRPRLELGVVNLDMMPRLEVEFEDTRAEPYTLDLKGFRTTVSVPNHQVGRVYGFTDADDDFNRRFFGAKDPRDGSTSIIVKATATPPKPESAPPEAPPLPDPE